MQISVLDQTPQIASKPFLVEKNGFWSITVPPKLSNSRGVVHVNNSPSIDLQDVYVARSGDTAATINAGISKKAALLLTPAIYELSEPIVIAQPNFVVLGIGLPTLVATNGRAALRIIAADVRVAGVLLEAGTDVSSSETDALMIWEGADGVGSDIFSRVGAFNYSLPSKPSCRRTRADVHVELRGDRISLDNTWFWHADHDDCNTGSDASLSKHGLVVRGAETRVYGLFNEHMFDDLLQWYGEAGEVYLYQSELPYHLTSFRGVGYHVDPNVTTHTCLGVGVYAISGISNVVAIRLPSNATARNMFAWHINAPEAESFSSIVCSGPDDSAKCYKAVDCDYCDSSPSTASACYKWLL